jgi:laminin gamma 1
MPNLRKRPKLFLRRLINNINNNNKSIFSSSSPSSTFIVFVLILIFIKYTNTQEISGSETDHHSSSSFYYKNNNPLLYDSDSIQISQQNKNNNNNNYNENDENDSNNHQIDINSVNNYDEINTNYYYDTSCYDTRTGQAKKCMPEFINAAYGLKITASNTCGVKQITEYCVQTNLHNSLNAKSYNYYFNNQNYYSNNYSESLGGSGAGGGGARCQKCDIADRRYAHPPDYLNDYNNPDNVTWWQSETMLEGVQYPNSVNLTLNLGKSFDINYIQIKFHSSRPESFAIYKRTYEHGPWVPYQYYSASCRETYNVPLNQIVLPGSEDVALCTDEFSDIAPLTGSSVVFGTLEDRPSAYNFENSPDLKEWVTATDIRITLDRMNTFGDEVFNDPQVLRSYYYAISDIAVGGRCKCNGHANKCSFEQQEDFEDRLVCKCEHNTDGVDCEKCLQFYNDVPWAPATDTNAHECKRKFLK